MLCSLVQIIQEMSSRQVEIKSIIARLKEWNKQLGGNMARKVEGSEFDFLQEEFLSKRHEVEKAQDLKEKEGLSTATAGLGYQIREGIQKMHEVVEKLQTEQRRLVKKKKDPPEVMERKAKIVQNCIHLLKDLQERQEDGMPSNKNKVVTLTEMKSRLLKEIDENNVMIHEKQDSDGQLSEQAEEDRDQIRKWKDKDAELDAGLDDIIVGVKGLKGKVKNMNQAQDIIIQKTKKGGEKAGTLANRIQGDNQKLKKIIEDFKPNRCCLYIALFLLMVGLIVTIIKILL